MELKPLYLKVKPSRTCISFAVMGLAVGFIGLGFVLGFMKSSSGYMEYQQWRYALGGGLGLSLYALYFISLYGFNTFRLLFTGKPVAEITPQGIVNRMSLAGSYDIKWEEIQEIYFLENWSPMRKWMGIIPKDTKGFYSKLTPRQQKHFKSCISNFMLPLNMEYNILNIKREDLIKTVEDYCKQHNIAFSDPLRGDELKTNMEEIYNQL